MKRSRLQPVRRRSRDSLVRLLKVDLLLLLLLVVAGGLYLLQRHPIRLSASGPPQTGGQAPDPGDEGDALLITPEPNPEQSAESFADLDFAYNWVNLLTQELGPHRLASLADFEPSMLTRTALVIVPRSVARDMSAGQVATLEQFVVRGGLVLVELPTLLWQPLVGVTADPTQYRPSRRITAFDGGVVRGELRDDVIQSPLVTVAAPVQVSDVAADPAINVILEVDGLPAFIARPLGDGMVFALYFDLARAVAVIQQGAPGADWEIPRPSARLAEGFTRTAMLVADAALRQTQVPSADLLERYVLNRVTAVRPMPRVWLFPGRATGGLAMTHSAEGPISTGRYLLDWEVEAGMPATAFVRSDDFEGVPNAVRPEQGILLVPPSLESAPMQRLGLFGLSPLQKPIALLDQVAALRAERSQGPIVARLAYGLWQPRYGETFRILAGLGVDADASYGPADRPTELEAVAGYSFGTGLPFQPIDSNGLPLPLLEIPTVLNDGQPLDADWSERLLERASQVYHELVVADWRTDTMIDDPRAEVVLTWRRLLQGAAEAGMWVTDLPTVVRFWHHRQEVRLRSDFSASERRLSVWVEAPAMEVPGGEPLPVGIAFEAQFEDRPVERVTRNGEDIPFVQLGLTGDGVFHLYAVPPGTSRLEITYQGPIEIQE